MGQDSLNPLCVARPTRVAEQPDQRLNPDGQITRRLVAPLSCLSGGNLQSQGSIRSVDL
jgi:hypothetical protein